MAVVVDKCDLAVPPFEPHYVARLRIGAVFEDRDHLPTFKPGRNDLYAIDPDVQVLGLRARCPARREGTGSFGFDHMHCDLLPPAAHRNAFASVNRKISRDRHHT
jgi:hypothetical protein